MEIKFDAQFDAALRAYAARRGDEASDDKASATEVFYEHQAHLDADDLNAFIEHAQPAAQTMLCAQHLAACAVCRRALVLLSRSLESETSAVESLTEVGANQQRESELPTSELPTSASSAHVPAAMRDAARSGFLANVTNARALAFALPVLAVVFAGVLWFALYPDVREPRIAITNNSAKAIDQTAAMTNQSVGNGMMSNQESAQSLNSNSNITGATSTSTQTAISNANQTTMSESALRATANANAMLAAPFSNTDLRERQSRTPNAVSVEQVANPARQDSATASTRSDNVSPSSIAESVGVAELPTNSRAFEGLPLALSNAAVAKENKAEQPDAAKDKNREVKSRSDEESDEEISIVADAQRRDVQADASQSSSVAADVSRNVTASPRARRESSGNEKRTVAGRTFSRQSGAWIDERFSFSMRVVTLARNSNQFRALAAEDATLRQIAAALDGEVLVVIKNQAYRLR